MQRGGRMLSLAGAALVVAAAIVLAIWGSGAILYALSEMQYGGIARILGPFFIALGLVAVVLAIGGAVGSWRTIRRGRRAEGALVGGLLIAGGSAALLYLEAWTDRLTFVVLVACAGVALAGAGWAIGGLGDWRTQRRARRTRS